MWGPDSFLTGYLEGERSNGLDKIVIRSPCIEDRPGFPSIPGRLIHRDGRRLLIANGHFLTHVGQMFGFPEEMSRLSPYIQPEEHFPQVRACETLTHLDLALAVQHVHLTSRIFPLLGRSLENLTLHFGL